MPASLPPVPAVAVPVSAVIALPAGIARPRHNVRYPGGNILITAWTYVELRGGRVADMPHNIGLTMSPSRAWDGLRTEEGAAIAG